MKRISKTIGDLLEESDQIGQISVSLSVDVWPQSVSDPKPIGRIPRYMRGNPPVSLKAVTDSVSDLVSTGTRLDDLVQGLGYDGDSWINLPGLERYPRSHRNRWGDIIRGRAELNEWLSAHECLLEELARHRPGDETRHPNRDAERELATLVLEGMDDPPGDVLVGDFAPLWTCGCDDD